MAALWRTLARQGRALSRLQALPRQSVVSPACFISTSKKNKDASTTVQPMEKSEELQKLEEHFSNTDPTAEKNWVSYGFEPTDPNLDTFVHHVTMFFTITLCICWGGFILAYQPDWKNLNWHQREAYLELERREREGLPLVSPDYVDADSIQLPEDEELGDQEIII